MRNTKNKIIEKSIELFNAEGFGNITIQKVAAQLGISLGNFTYHFPKKDDLVLTIYKQLLEELNQLVKTYSASPDFRQIDQQVRAFYHFQKKYKFFYRATLAIENAYPLIGAEHRKNISHQISNIKYLLSYNVKSGLFNEKILEEEFNAANLIWMVVAFWTTNLELRGIPDEGEQALSDAVWSVLKPHFTNAGTVAYKELKK